MKKTIQREHNERIARLRTHQKNIERYQSLLKTKLSDVEQQYLEKRISEEHSAIAMLQLIDVTTR